MVSFGLGQEVRSRSVEFKKMFTVQEAEETLPLVKRIVRDILATAGTIRVHLREPDHERTDSQLSRSQNELDEYLAELESIGCFFKDWDYSIGLVDFPSQIDGETVFLCWRSDEEKLAFYHRIDDGYRGRRPIPAATRQRGPTE